MTELVAERRRARVQRRRDRQHQRRARPPRRRACTPRSSDDGVGIAEDFSWEGTGLGLQIVQRLVTDELKGDLEMHRNGGTRVEIDVPLPGLSEPVG